MNNRIFFQHPDLMRLLSVHENVMSIMMNILTAQQGAVEHEGEEVKEKAPIKVCRRFVGLLSRLNTRCPSRRSFAMLRRGVTASIARSFLHF